MSSTIRLALRQFLAENLPSEWSDTRSAASDYNSHANVRREWGRRLFAGGWAGPVLSRAAGGLGLVGDDLVAYLEDMATSGAPEVLNSNAIAILAPVLAAYGTGDQRDRAIPAMLAHDVLWCQGFSEPDAGSDLADLRTRAVASAGGWRVWGQKVWTSNALNADYCYLLARTDPAAGAHAGLSLMMLDMRQPGVEVRPLRNMAGTDEFCEVFLEDALVRSEDLIGEPGDGWRLASFALEQERASMLAQRALRMSRELADAYVLLGPDGAARVERELGRVHAAVRASEAAARRALTLIASGKSPGALAHVTKLQWSLTHQRLLDVVADGVGPDFFADSKSQGWVHTMLFSRAETIYGGTSEIQRNLIARSLGLPRSLVMTSVRDFDERAIADGLNDALAGNGGPFDRAAWRKLAGGGWLDMLVAGAASPARELTRLISPMEQWGTALPAGPVLLTLAWTLPVLRAAAAGQLTDDIASGAVVTATRELTSVDACATFRAEEDAGGWRLSGHARLVPWLPDADIVLVSASTAGGAGLVAAVSTSGFGVRLTADETVDLGLSIGDLALDGAVADTVIEADAAVLGGAAAMYSLALDAQAVGGAAALVARTVGYVTDRHQFGQPVGSFQAVKHRLADMVVATETARALLRLAADRLASRPLDPPWEDIDASRVSCGDAFRKVAADAIQCHGGMGFTWEEGIHLYYRRALVAGTLLGDVEAAARRLVRYGIGRSEATA